ncbi:MAG: S-methyl-5'-thioadenosine phosphorylase [Actinomycetia bacterium]|nr:S-methyl-5'-thioadenosine phosphorylase [Actinomycetes bacterium]
MEDKQTAQVGVFGGSGFYSFLDKAEKIEVETPYGSPSDKVVVGTVEGIKVAFIPRHGSKHDLPPHKINYRANIYAMKKLGVTQIFGPCAVGSLQPHIKPGQFVICDQFVDRTKGRIDTFYDGPKTIHVSAAKPYCPRLSRVVSETAQKMGLQFHDRGTVVVIQGPRFSTKAESKWFSSQGWEVINMTQYPEAYLAREMEICYANISLITDYDAGLEDYPEIEPVSSEEIINMFKQNNDKLRELLFKSIPRAVTERNCICSTALKDAVVN